MSGRLLPACQGADEQVLIGVHQSHCLTTLPYLPPPFLTPPSMQAGRDGGRQGGDGSREGGQDTDCARLQSARVTYLNLKPPRVKFHLAEEAISCAKVVIRLC